MPQKQFVIYSFYFPGNSTDENSAIYGMDGLNGTQIYFMIYLLGGLCGVILCTVILGFSIAMFLWSKKLKKKRENELSGVLSSFWVRPLYLFHLLNYSASYCITSPTYILLLIFVVAQFIAPPENDLPAANMTDFSIDIESTSPDIFNYDTPPPSYDQVIRARGESNPSNIHRVQIDSISKFGKINESRKLSRNFRFLTCHLY